MPAAAAALSLTINAFVVDDGNNNNKQQNDVDDQEGERRRATGVSARSGRACVCVYIYMCCMRVCASAVHRRAVVVLGLCVVLYDDVVVVCV